MLLSILIIDNDTILNVNLCSDPEYDTPDDLTLNDAILDQDLLTRINDLNSHFDNLLTCYEDDDLI